MTRRSDEAVGRNERAVHDLRLVDRDDGTCHVLKATENGTALVNVLPDHGAAEAYLDDVRHARYVCEVIEQGYAQQQARKAARAAGLVADSTQAVRARAARRRSGRPT